MELKCKDCRCRLYSHTAIYAGADGNTLRHPICKHCLEDRIRRTQWSGSKRKQDRTDAIASDMASDGWLRNSDGWWRE